MVILHYFFQMKGEMGIIGQVFAMSRGVGLYSGLLELFCLIKHLTGNEGDLQLVKRNNFILFNATVVPNSLPCNSSIHAVNLNLIW